MGFSKRAWLATVVASGIFAAMPAYAADSCSDILVNGAFASTKFRSTEMYRQYVYSSFRSASYQESKNKTVGGITIPLGEAILGANYSEDTMRKRQSQISQTLTDDTEIRSDRDVALYFGDDTIISAWSQCMQLHNSGLSLRFAQYPGAPTEALLYIEWFPAMGVMEAPLKSDILLPEGVSAAAGTEQCLKAGAKIRAQTGCLVHLKFDVSSRTVLLTAQATIGPPAEAYLPARMRLQVDTDVDNILASSGMDTNLKAKQASGFSGGFDLPNARYQEGWYIDEDTVQWNLYPTYGGNVGGRCYDWNATKGPYSLSYTFRSEASKHASVNCAVRGKANLKRERFVPM